MEGGQFGIHVPGTIPCQVIATDTNGEDHHIGDFEGGVVLNQMMLQDVQSRVIIASFSMTRRQWVIKGKNYPLVFMQVKPVD